MYQIDFTKPCHVHFIGIGGISMSGLAEILAKEGFTVTGSDVRESDVTKMLESRGIRIYFGQVAGNLKSEPDTALVVYTAAISDDNEEFLYAKELGLPLLSRAELLGQIMDNYKYSIAVSGTHGKTTTTAMLAHILLAAEKDPTVSIGGMLDVIGGNIRAGASPYFVTEACEYTNSYHAFRPYLSIILNIDNDHLDFFHNLENIVKSFATFATKLQDGGILIVNGDMPYLADIRAAVAGKNCRLITFGMGEENDYRAADVVLDEGGHPTYTLIRKPGVLEGVDAAGDSANAAGADADAVTGAADNEAGAAPRVTLSVTGEHNAMNSLSAIAAAEALGIGMDRILAGLRTCSSAKRRFEYKGTTKAGVTVVDDYAHHPTEIAATVSVGRSVAKGDLWIAFQPHTYSRTKALLPDFAKALSPADHVLLADIYAAREKDDGTIHSRDLERELRKYGTDALYLGDFAKIKKYFSENCKNNDLLITMGAGPIDSIGVDLVSE